MPRTSEGLSGRSKSKSLMRSNVTACSRCKRRKKKCDQKLPACGMCEAAGVECIGYDAVTQRNVSRSYLFDLENEVALLRSSVGEVRNSNSMESESPYRVPVGISRPVPTSGSQSVLTEVTAREVSAPRLSDLLLNSLMRFDRANYTSITQEDLFREGNTSHWISSPGLDLPTESLPTREGAERLIKVYFEFANFHLPLLHETTLRRRLEIVYSGGAVEQERAESVPGVEIAAVAKFYVNMVFALAFLILQKHDPSIFPTVLCDRYYRTALTALHEGMLPEGLEGVQALLLIAQYAYLHPLNRGGWNIIGLALRRAVELGLHEDPPTDKLDFVTVDTMRRTFWIAYSLDRNISMARGRPNCLSDGAITAKYPSFVDDEFITPNGIEMTGSGDRKKTKLYSMYWFRYRQLQSEMCTVLREKPPTPFHSIDYAQWQANMHTQIQKWYDEVRQESQPCHDGVGKNSESSRFELTFQRAVFFLYRPSTIIPSPSTPALIEMSTSASKVIKLYKQFYSGNRIHLFWQAAENIFDAGTALMYSYLQSEAVQATISLQDLENLTHMSSNVLWALVERFPAFQDKRDAFDRMRSKTLTHISRRNPVTNAAYPEEETERPSQFGLSEIVEELNGRHEITGNHLESNFRMGAIDATTTNLTNSANTDNWDMLLDPSSSVLDNILTSSWNVESLQNPIDWANLDNLIELDALAWDWE